MKLLSLLLFVSLFFISEHTMASLSWTKRADFGGPGRHRTTSTSVGNKGYMGLGHFNGTGVETYFADWWEYDPATNSWTQKADYIGNNGHGELGARAFSLETVCYVGLGELEHLKLYKYDPALNQWTQVANAPSGNNFQDTQDLLIGHKAYFTDLWHDELYEYDADTDTWTLLGFLPFEWYYSFSGFTHGGKAYVKAWDELWEYDPSINIWSFKDSFPGYAELSSICFMQREKAYIVCGYGPTHGDLCSEVWEYDPVTEIWTQKENFDGVSRRYSTGFSIGDRSYLGTGTNGTNMNDFWEFNAVAGVEDMKNEFSVSVYPNPAVEKVTIKANHESVFEAVLMDINGKEIQSKSSVNGKITFERNGLTPGSYLYKIHSEASQTTSGIILFK